jgi:hypothetical protein
MNDGEIRSNLSAVGFESIVWLKWEYIQHPLVGVASHNENRYPKILIFTGNNMMTVEDIVESIDRLSIEDQEKLFELVRKRRIEQQEAEILASRRELKQAIADGTAKKGTVQDLITDLLGDDDASCLE